MFSVFGTSKMFLFQTKESITEEGVYFLQKRGNHFSYLNYVQIFLHDWPYYKGMDPRRSSLLLLFFSLSLFIFLRPTSSFVSLSPSTSSFFILHFKWIKPRAMSFINIKYPQNLDQRQPTYELLKLVKDQRFFRPDVV